MEYPMFTATTYIHVGKHDDKSMIRASHGGAERNLLHALFGLAHLLYKPLEKPRAFSGAYE
jgi:hypothetical protein